MIPFNRVDFEGNEYLNIKQAVASGHISGDGRFTEKCQLLLTEICQAKACLLTTSCTHALEMSALLLDMNDQDEVVMPSFTFVSTANAYALRGAKIRFADIREDTLNMDATHAAAQMSDRTKALVTVHYAGVGCEMEALQAQCDQHQAHLVEDNAHGLFASYRGQALGSFGTFSTLSFHETKNMSSGEGGALLLNDTSYVERAEILREKGTNRKQFFRGQVDKYTWVDLGSSYVQSEILAAVLWAQLQRREQIQAARMHIWQSYQSALGDWARVNGAKMAHVPTECEQPAHLFYLLMPDAATRARFLEHSRANKILSVFHYVPLHLSPIGVGLGYRPGQLPVTEDCSRRLVRLPLFAGLSADELQRVIEMVLSFKS